MRNSQTISRTALFASLKAETRQHELACNNTILIKWWDIRPPPPHAPPLHHQYHLLPRQAQATSHELLLAHTMRLLMVYGTSVPPSGSVVHHGSRRFGFQPRWSLFVHKETSSTVNVLLSPPSPSSTLKLLIVVWTVLLHFWTVSFCHIYVPPCLKHLCDSLKVGQ